MSAEGGCRRAPLGGCDCYLLALEDLMMRAGQGRHVGVTVVEVGKGFSVDRLRHATGSFAANQPLLGADLRRGWPGMVPSWHLGRPGRIDVEVHQPGRSWRELAVARLRGAWPGRMRFDVVPCDGGGATVMMGWSHLVLDARGIELALAELARLGSVGGAQAERESWALPFASVDRGRRTLGAVRPFLARYWKLRESDVVSAGPPPARPAFPAFEVVRFSTEETASMKKRAQPVTGGLFALPWFLAVTMRAHAEVLRTRGVGGTLECTISVQGRKRGARGPIFQNQVSQLHFALPMDCLVSPEAAARELHAQFAAMTRSKYDEAFIVMIDWMRRLPPFLYRRFLRKEACGQIASFYHAHTGEFLPGVDNFCGGEVLDGWHIPSVPQPPGTGLFFSERAGRLTASLCWREGVLSPEDKHLMLGRLRADLLEP